MGVNIRRKRKIEKAIEFIKRIKKVQEEVGAVLKKVQEEIKQQVDRVRKEVKVWKVGDKMILSTKRFGVQRETSKEISRLLYQSTYY